MKRAIVIVCWICVIVTGAFLRFDDLAKRPFHADEATGARITARRMESGGGQFDPEALSRPAARGPRNAGVLCKATEKTAGGK